MQLPKNPRTIARNAIKRAKKARIAAGKNSRKPSVTPHTSTGIVSRRPMFLYGQAALDASKAHGLELIQYGKNNDCYRCANPSWGTIRKHCGKVVHRSKKR